MEVFCEELLPEFDIGGVKDLVLLLGLGAANSAVNRLFDLLGQRDFRARAAHCLVQAWVRKNASAFPEEQSAAELLRCIELLELNKHSCCCGFELWRCPPAVLALLNLRLGCRLQKGVCCSLLCWLGVKCSELALPAGESVLCDSRTAVQGALRTVLLSCDGSVGLPLCRMLLKLGTEPRPVLVSVLDSPLAARAAPMQLTALRAALQHRMWRALRVEWLCPLTPLQKGSTLLAQARLPDCTAVAFRSLAVASEWAEKAARLDQLFRSRSSSAEAAATEAGQLMREMVPMLSHCYCEAVQKVLQLPILDVSLMTKGHFVYCLLSPFLAKVYVGAVGLKSPRAPYARLREHLRMAKLWSSRTSERRYGQRAPDLYKALSKAGLGNIVMVILAATEQHALAHAERCFIRWLSPVYNVNGVVSGDGLPRAVVRLLGAAGSEDVRLVASKLLRKNRPRLPLHVWPVLVAQVLRTGDRELAAKLARQARQLHPQLGKLCAVPRLVFPCPVPAQVLKQLRVDVKAALIGLPFVRRAPQFAVVLEGTAVCWEKTPFAEAVLSPATIPWDLVGPCRCGALPACVPRYQGHVICRSWQQLTCCEQLWQVAGAASLQCRTYPSLQRIAEQFEERLVRFLRRAGFPEERARSAAAAVGQPTLRTLGPWMASLAPVLKQRELVAARKKVWEAGLLLVRVDRSPGRVVVLCRELWNFIQNATFLESSRYLLADVPSSTGDPLYGRHVREAFLAAVDGAAQWVGRTPAGGSDRPQCYWTVKQKSLISSVAEPVVKLRPIVTHCRHPLRVALKRVARALAVLVTEARELVLQRRPAHLPMWQLHAGSAEWLKRVSPTKGWWGCEEYDVADCFLNTPREAVLEAVGYWLRTTQRCSRRQPCFAISKDGKAGDHRGRPSSIHYWEITAVQLLAACAWDLQHDDLFEAQAGAGVQVLQQRKGLPIGGHLSAAYVELVALQREYICEWPPSLSGLPTTRYRDNFFMVVREERGAAERERTAVDLSELLLMPVGFERAGRVARCLELRLDWTAEAAVKATLAYRTDADRQGESSDVRTWPEWQDPRAPALLRGLLAGLASKLLRYSEPGLGGLPASIRRAVRFLRQRGYPTHRWYRAFGCELLRQGAPIGCLPKEMRVVLRPASEPSQDSELPP